MDRRNNQRQAWMEVCRTRFFHCLLALCDLSRDGNWPTPRWGEALQVWSEEGMILRSWRNAAPLVQTMPDSVIQEIVHGVTSWIEIASKYTDLHEDIMLGVLGRILELPLETSTGIKVNDKPIERSATEAINHPVGHVTQALINLWFKRKPNDSDLLPSDIKPLFTKLCDVEVGQFCHGRLLLGAHLISLFRVDPIWTKQYLLPLFDWGNPVDAIEVWEGFLWSPRLYPPLLLAFKSQFLDTAEHYNDLGENKGHFAAFLTYAALDSIEGFTADDFRSAFELLPQDGLEESAVALVQALEGAANQCEDYWKNRVLPLWKHIWPKSVDRITPQITESLSRLAISARGEFPSALVTLHDWLQPIGHSNHVVHLLHKSGLCGRYPAEALRLLGTIFAKQQWPPSNLKECLEAIQHASPRLVENVQFKRLKEYLRKKGMN
jgi:hypothetical protein